MVKARLLVVAAAGMSAWLLAERWQPPRPAAGRRSPSFATQVAALSEPGGYFDTDNLISNERSYLQVMPDLRRSGLRGRRLHRRRPGSELLLHRGRAADDRLHHRHPPRQPAAAPAVQVALSAVARTRVEYLALLLGRRLPARSTDGTTASIEQIVAYIDAAQNRSRTRRDARPREGHRRRIWRAALAQTMWRRSSAFTIASSKQASICASSRRDGRRRATIPTIGICSLGRDPEGVAANYLASEEAFQVVKDTARARPHHPCGRQSERPLRAGRDRRARWSGAAISSPRSTRRTSSSTCLAMEASGTSPPTCDASPTRIAA